MVIKGMATWLSWTEAEVSTQETGIWPQATSMWSLYPVQVSLAAQRQPHRATAAARADFLVADAVLKNQSAEAEFC